ncbi:MAG TPA: hypothetical protein VFV51_09590 [Vicinamibacterales bacterium]|nr:hypothetical protein [Vicinamibacterales bacterium]
MKQIAPFAFVVLMATAVMHLTTAVAASAGARTVVNGVAVVADTVKVSITYKGKGTVDANHRIWVWLFDTPDIGPGSMPIAELSISANGGTASFDGIDAKRVWIAAAFDESGTMSGNAPPPSGSPIGILAGADGAPKSVVPGEDAAVMTFDDSQRMP